MRALVSASVCVLALLAAACGGGGSVSVHGRLLRADGSPAAGYRAILNSLSLDLDGDTADSDVFTDAEGRYELTGNLRDVPYDDVRLDVGFYDPDGQLRLELSMPSAGGDHAIPDQRLWDDQLVAAPLPGGGVRATWAAPAGVDGVTYQLEAYQAGPTPPYLLPSWQAYALTTTSYDLPADLIEDRFASLQLFIGDYNPQYFCHKDLCVQWLSAMVDTSQGSLVPVSRGARCTTVVGSGQSVPLLGRAGAPCGLTDGYVDYFAWLPEDWVCGAAQCSNVHEVTVDLGAALPLQTIVVRYLYLEDDDAAQVEVSPDGTTFTPIATVDQSSGIIYERIHLDVPVSARFVRVTPAAGGTIAAFAELSAF